MRAAAPIALAICLMMWSAMATAQEAAEDDHSAVLEAGAAGEHSVSGGSSRFGAAVGVEVTPIENWLEVEFGVAALRGSGATEISSDLVFKVPYRLSPTAEFMIGLGPFVSRTVNSPDASTAHGIEVALDFMFWPHKEFGWYLEPSWSRAAGSGERTIGVTIGLLFGLH
ncbi:conserved exported hypothetical protein [Burkholderiales bacterium]|nr:conserved exported hypothetical protein [Burkholderiales bacterium]